MRKSGNSVIGTLLIVGVCLIILQACSGNSDDSIKPSAVKPYITVHPTSTDYVTGDTIAALKVTATISNSDKLSYQWFEVDTFTNSGGSEISNATDSTFTPAITQGTKHYYVKVTSSSSESSKTASKISNPARIRFLSAAEAEPSTSINVSNDAAQYVRGFGGMSNAFDNIGPSGIARYIELKDINTLFDQEDGLGMNILRISLWPYPLEQVLSGEVFPVMGNQNYYDLVKRVNSLGGYVLASPWTAPADFKTNESLSAGGHLKREYYGIYANYLRNFCQTMANNGAPIYAISIQNEPNLVVGYDGMEWTEAEHRDFMRDHGNFTRKSPAVKAWGGGKEQSHVRIMMGEPHNPTDIWYGAAMDLVLNDEGALANADIAAYHTYGGIGNKNIVTRNGRLTTAGVETWMTEYNLNSGAENLYFQDSTWDFVWPFIEYAQHVIVNNNSNGFVWWYLKRFYGIIGEGAYGTINGAPLPRGYALSHFAKYATDTVRLEASLQNHPSSSNVRISAYQRKTNKTTPAELQVMTNEDSISLVVYNQRILAGASTDIKINLPDGFTASNAFGIISDNNQKHAPVLVILAKDGKSATFNLPVNTIISVKFVK